MMVSVQTVDLIDASLRSTAAYDMNDQPRRVRAAPFGAAVERRFD